MALPPSVDFPDVLPYLVRMLVQRPLQPDAKTTGLAPQRNSPPSANRPKTVDLRHHLLRLTLGTLLPVILFAAIGAVFLALREQATFERGVRERTRAVMTAIDAKIRSSIATLEALSVSSHLDRGDLGAFYAEAVRVAGSQQDWLTVNLTTPAGKTLLNVMRPFGEILPDQIERASLDRVLATGQPAVGDLATGALTGMWAFPVRIPVVRDGATRYVLSAAVKPESIYSILLAQQLPSDWIGVVVDRNRRFLARTVSNAERIGQISSKDLQAQVSSAPDGWKMGRTVEGTRVYTAHDNSTLSGWAFAIGVPAHVVESAARQNLLFLLLGTLGAIGLALLLAPFLARRFAAPITALAESARAMARGEVTRLPPPSAVTEVADLARALSDAGAAVREREEVQRQLAAVTDTATVALFMTDADHCFTFMNPAAESMTGYSLDEARGVSLHDLLHRSNQRELHPAAQCELMHRLSARQLVAGEDVLARKNGRTFDVAYAASPLQSGTTAVATVIEVRDVTNEKSIEIERALLLRKERLARTEAERANQAKDEFLAMLGHELRNPLAAISNASYLLERADAPHAGAARDVIRRQSAQLARLVDDLLDAGRVATGKIMIAQNEVALADVVRRASATLSAAGRAGRHRLTLELEDVCVSGDETRLEQIVTNLLSNALRYTPAEGAIRISLAAVDDECVLTIADSGIGISAEMLPRVFDLFVQGERGIEREEGGLGIGLTLVKRLVELHGGSVDVASDGAGRGSTFTIRLPRLVGMLPAQPELVGSPPAVNSRRILLIEDNADVREMLRLALETAGHTVMERSTGTTGLEAALNECPDIAIIDIGLPGIDGYELARQIRAAVLLPPITLIALTGYGQVEDRKRALQAGFDAHLVKPVAPSDLLQAVAEFRAHP